MPYSLTRHIEPSTHLLTRTRNKLHGLDILNRLIESILSGMQDFVTIPIGTLGPDGAGLDLRIQDERYALLQYLGLSEDNHAFVTAGLSFLEAISQFRV